MKKSVQILLAGALGVFTVWGLLRLRKLVESSDYEDDYHFLKGNKKNRDDDESDSVELNAYL